MKTRNWSVLAGAGATLVVAGSASAGFVGVETVSVPNGVGLYVCNVYALFNNTSDQLTAVAGTPTNPLNIAVQNGTFYQDPQGMPLTAPPSSQLPGLSGMLTYDTFATIGVRTDDLLDLNDNVTAIGLAFAPDSLSSVSGSWFIFPGALIGSPDQNGRVLVFQGSFDEDGGATGLAGSMLLQFTSNGLPGQQAYVNFNHSIPSPGVLATLGVAGLMGTRRRRRD